MDLQPEKEFETKGTSGTVFSRIDLLIQKLDEVIISTNDISQNLTKPKPETEDPNTGAKCKESELQSHWNKADYSSESEYLSTSSSNENLESKSRLEFEPTEDEIISTLILGHLSVLPLLTSRRNEVLRAKQYLKILPSLDLNSGFNR